jgi:hypothetical protein
MSKPDDEPGGERTFVEIDIEAIITNHSQLNEQDIYLISSRLLAEYDEKIKSGLSAADARKYVINECKKQSMALGSKNRRAASRQRRLYASVGVAMIVIPIITFLLIAR